MNKEHYLKIFNNMKKNSIGGNKRVKVNKTSVKATLKKSIAMMLSMVAIASFVGCTTRKKEKERTSISMSEEFNGYTYNEISRYEELRVNDLMDLYDMNDYTMDGYKKSYNYTYKDYEKITQLDETYLRGFYLCTDDLTVTEVSKSLGYENIDDYMKKNGYSSLEEWTRDDLENISEMMKSRGERSK